MLLVHVFMPNIIFAQKLTLDLAIEEALTNNPDIVRTMHEMKSAKAEFWKMISPRSPYMFAEFEGVPENQSLSEYGGRKIGFSQDIEFPLAYYYRGKKQQFSTTEKEAEVHIQERRRKAKKEREMIRIKNGHIQ